MDLEKIDEDMFLIEVGKRIRSIRKRKGLTLYQVEDAGWACWQHMQRVETNGQNLRLLTLRRIAKLYGITLSELFSELE